MGASQSRDDDSSVESNSEMDDEHMMSEMEAKEEIKKYKESIGFSVTLAQMATFLLGSYLGQKMLRKLCE